MIQGHRFESALGSGKAWIGVVEWLIESRNQGCLEKDQIKSRARRPPVGGAKAEICAYNIYLPRKPDS